MRTKFEPEEPSQAYLDEVLCILRDALSGDLLGLYLHGSAVQCDFRSETSDIDLLGLVSGPLVEARKFELVSRLAHCAKPVPAAGLEIILVLASAVKEPVFDFPFEFALATGVSWPTQSEPSATSSDIVIHIELCRQSGRALFGPSPKEVFGSVDRTLLCRALIEELRWHKKDLLRQRSESTLENAVVNAARSVLVAESGRLVSKSEGARDWLRRFPNDDLVSRALACRLGEDFAPISQASVEAFLDKAIELVPERLD